MCTELEKFLQAKECPRKEWRGGLVNRQKLEIQQEMMRETSLLMNTNECVEWSRNETPEPQIGKQTSRGATPHQNVHVSVHVQCRRHMVISLLRRN
jgi:hypothetical protein